MNNSYKKISISTIFLILIGSLIFSYLLGTFLYRTPIKNKIDFFISTSYVESEYFENIIGSIENVDKINIISRTTQNNYFEQALQTVGMYSDLIILSEKYLDTAEKIKSFSSIDLKYFEEYNLNTNDFELIIIDNKIYGIVVYNKDNNINLFKDKIVFEQEEKYILCVGKNTKNAIDTPTNEKETNNAFIALMEILKNTPA